MYCVVSIVRYGLRLKNPRKDIGPDFNPLKVIKFASNVNNSHIYNTIIKDLKKVLRSVKTVLGRPIFKKNETDKIGNYRPVSILNGTSKIYGRCIHNSLSSYAETILSSFISTYKEYCSSNHVLLRLIENWKKFRNNKNVVGTSLMDLSKAFVCIPHDLLAAKLHACGLSDDAVTFVHLPLKRRKQSVKMNGTEKIFPILLSCIPQGVY